MKLISDFDKPPINVYWISNRNIDDKYINGFKYCALPAFPYEYLFRYI